MNISDKYKCIFVHIPKAAGTSIKDILELPGRGHPPWSYFMENFPDEWGNYTKFTVVRNPWDRVVSAYCYAKMEDSYWHSKDKGRHPDYELLKNRSFEECCKILLEERDALKHESWHAQYLWVISSQNGRATCMVDHVLHCENLSGEFADLCRTLSIDSAALPHINTSKRKHYKKYYNPRTRKIIARIYAADIQLFQYSY